MPLLLAVPLLLGLVARAADPPPGAAAQEGVQVVASEDLPEGPDGGRSLSDWYALGGWVMHLIVLCSIVSVALVAERMWSLRRGAVIPRKFLSQIRDHWHRREIPQVVTLCSASNTSIARVLRAGLLHFQEGLARVEDAIDSAGAYEATFLRRNLALIASVANIATMLGLLGTVLGMIESFDLIAKTGTGDARVVAGGIFQALVTTAAGLSVGIFAISLHSWLRRKVEVLVLDLEAISIGLLEDLASETETGRREELRQGGLAPQEA
jgi:biopolymer transport protein ExbB